MKRFTLAETSARIDRRIAEGVRIPPVDDLRNDGTRRTASKRQLLQTLERVAQEQGRKPPFPAKY
jgi:hypothetical protein